MPANPARLVDNCAAVAHGEAVSLDPQPAPSDPATLIRRRIATILDEVPALPRDEFAQRATLAHERNTLTARLRTLSANDELANAWAERAPYRSPDDVQPHIASHSEGGGSMA